MSVPFLALCERGHTGPKIEKETWDLDYVFEETSSIVEEYGLDRRENEVGALRGSAHPALLPSGARAAAAHRRV